MICRIRYEHDLLVPGRAPHPGSGQPGRGWPRRLVRGLPGDRDGDVCGVLARVETPAQEPGVDELDELLAGHTGLFRVLQRLPREAWRSVPRDPASRAVDRCRVLRMLEGGGCRPARTSGIYGPALGRGERSARQVVPGAVRTRLCADTRSAPGCRARSACRCVLRWGVPSRRSARESRGPCQDRHVGARPQRRRDQRAPPLARHPCGPYIRGGRPSPHRTKPVTSQLPRPPSARSPWSGFCWIGAAHTSSASPPRPTMRAVSPRPRRQKKTCDLL